MLRGFRGRHYVFGISGMAPELYGFGRLNVRVKREEAGFGGEVTGKGDRRFLF